MTRYAAHPNADGLIKLTGTIKDLKILRRSASFVFTESDHNKLGVVAMVGALAGAGGAAVATAANAGAIEEESDFLSFDLDGKHVEGWVWRHPQLRDGDEVHVAGESRGHGYELFGIVRPSDRAIAAYPHCSRARSTHIRTAIKWYLILGVGSVFFMYLPMTLFHSTWRERVQELSNFSGWWVPLGLLLFFLAMTISLARKWMPFVRVAEKVFRTLELPNPSTIDLVKSSKARRKPDDPAEYGTFWFRY
jgi:hypothetical protein